MLIFSIWLACLLSGSTCLLFQEAFLDHPVYGAESFLWNHSICYLFGSSLTYKKSKLLTIQVFVKIKRENEYKVSSIVFCTRLNILRSVDSFRPPGTVSGGYLFYVGHVFIPLSSEWDWKLSKAGCGLCISLWPSGMWQSILCTVTSKGFLLFSIILQHLSKLKILAIIYGSLSTF